MTEAELSDTVRNAEKAIEGLLHLTTLQPGRLCLWHKVIQGGHLSRKICEVAAATTGVRTRDFELDLGAENQQKAYFYDLV